MTTLSRKTSAACKIMSTALCAALTLAMLPPSAVAAAVEGPAGSAVAPGAIALPAPAIPGVAAPAAPQAEAGSPAAAAATAEATLQTGAQAVGAAKGEGEQAAALDSLYTGAKTGGDSSAVDASGASGAASSGLSAPAGDFEEARAVDSSLPLDRRLAMVKKIAERGPAGQQTLERVAAANRDGGAEDYEIHRAALRALAEQGVVESLRPVSRKHADQILAKLNADKPAAVVADYDDTLSEFRKPIPPYVAAALKGAADAGVDVAVLTDRTDIKRNEKDTTILDSLDGMTLAQKQAITVAADSGARLLEYDAQGKAVVTVDAKLSFTDKQRDAIKAASAATAEKFGRYEFNGQEENLSAFKWVRFLPLGMPAEQVQAAAAFMRERLAANGAPEIAIDGRQAADPKNPSYLTISLLDKSVGVNALRSSRDERERFKDTVRHPSLAKLASKLPSWLVGGKSQPIAGKDTLVLGDSFFGTRMVDALMSKAAPGALTIAVGGQADPRVDNVFVWPTKGGQASAEILGALAKPSSTSIDKKTFAGLFTQRTIGMIAFMGMVIALPFAAVPVIGWSGYGVIMAFGPMAGIAAAAVTGGWIDKLGSRDSFALNTLLRGLVILAVPAFAHFGILNFWTLMLAAVGEGWMISTIMTTEGAMVRRLFPVKHLGWINAVLFQNYLGLQVLLGLIMGFGQIVDKLDPYTVLLGAAVINLGVVLPIIWATIPNTKSTAPAAKPGEARTPFLKRYWKEAGLFAAALAAAPLLQVFPAVTAALGISPVVVAALLIASALVYWISRTDGAAKMSAGEFTKPAADGTKAPLMRAVGLMALSALMMYPLQYFILPNVAEALAGAAGKGQLLGEFLGALFLGNLIATAAQARLPEMRLPFVGRFGPEFFIQAAVVGLTFTWLAVTMGAGLLAAFGGAAVAAAAMYLGRRLSDRGWLQLMGLGFASLWLPYLTWLGFVPFLSLPMAWLASMVAVGLAYGPIYVKLISYIMGHTAQEHSGKVQGVVGGYFNGAISIGYGLTTLAAGFLHPVFPALLAAFGIFYLLGGGAFFRSPSWLPGLPKRIVNDATAAKLDSWKRRLKAWWETSAG